MSGPMLNIEKYIFRGETPKGRRYPWRARCEKSKQNPAEPPESPAVAKKESKKKRKLESGSLASEEYSERISTLQQLRKEEEKIKIAIDFEKLKKEEPVILDTDVLQKKIAEYQRLLQEARSEHKMKTVMCANLQMANTLQKIVGKTKAHVKQNDFSESQRKCIEDLLKRKKDFNRSISIKRKEIAVIDEDILKLQKAVSSDKETKKKCVLRSKNTKMNDVEELERLEENNEKVAERVHLLSEFIQSLVPRTGRREESDLLELMAECEKVSKCRLDKSDDIKECLTSVRSVNL